MSFKQRLPAIAWTFGSLVVGTAVAFMFVFRTLFTDSVGGVATLEIVVTHALNVAAYLVVVTLAVRFGPPPGSAWIASLTLPAIVILLNYSEPTLALRVVTFVMMAIGSAAGAFVGTWWRGRQETVDPKSE